MIVVATDDKRIEQHCLDNLMRVVMTGDQCLTGTDRVAEVAETLDANWYINVQGDEPFLDPHSLQAIMTASHGAASIVQVINAFSAITDEDDFRSVTVPKVVCDVNNRLIYASRAAIPTTKSLQFVHARRQIGLYAFSKDALHRFAKYGKKTPLEELEDIEILRFVEMGLEVLMIEVDSVGIAIDTPQDLARATQYLKDHPELI
jgi:3-deoxy-manno-octulosonate cytidylyltransferase (CMP-KDO synthetase)